MGKKEEKVNHFFPHSNKKKSNIKSKKVNITIDKEKNSIKKFDITIFVHIINYFFFCN